MLRVTLVRHGETTANNTDTLQGQLHGNLSKKGKDQARFLKKALRPKQFDCVISTDLKRGLETTKTIIGHHSIPLVCDPLLRERNFGVFQGTNRTCFYNHERSLDDRYNNRPKEGESFQDLYDRAKKFIEKLKLTYQNKRVLVISHGDWIRMCLGVLKNIPVSKAAQIRQTNACINEVQIDGDSFELIKLNSVEHLPVATLSNNKTDL